MGSDVLKLTARQVARLAEALAAQQSEKPLRVGLVRDAGTRSAMGAVPRFPGLDLVTLDLATHDEFADFDISTHSAQLAAEMEARIRDFITNGRLDLIVEATGRTLTGAMICHVAIDCGHSIVSLNPRTDLALGRYLRHEAHSRGLRYVFWQSETVRAALELRQALEAAELRILSLGAAVPASGEGDEALTSSDASSVMIDMACLANATGISFERPGMNGMRCSLADLALHYRPMNAGGILAVDSCIDYMVLNEGERGVYAVVEERSNSQADAKAIFRTFYSPIAHSDHGWLAGIAEALDEHVGPQERIYRPVADVCAIAVRDVKPGERLAGTGGTDYRNVAMRIDEIRWRESIPIGLLEGAMAKQIIEADEPIVLENCVIDHTSRLYALRGIQEGLRLAS
jgi:predicted homoserine dehydrogenase-like protein